MKNCKRALLSIFTTIILFLCTISSLVQARGVDIPVISVSCDNTIDDFLQSICADIYYRSGERFVLRNLPIGSGWQSDVYKLEGQNGDLCVKVFKPDVFRRLTNGYSKEHTYYYHITGEKYSQNFLGTIRNSNIKNICLPVAAYKYKGFFANISRFGGSVQLSELINNKVILDEKQTKMVIRDILKGVNHLHSCCSYSHNDLYPPNIVLSVENDGYFSACVIDANTIHKECTSRLVNSVAKITGYRIWRYINFLTLNSIWPYVNLNQGYYDPEDLNCIPVNQKSDIFAIGVIMWELLLGDCPFAGSHRGNMSALEAMTKLNECLNKIGDNRNLSADCKDLLLKLLHPTKNGRISSSEALNHNFLKTEG